MNIDYHIHTQHSLDAEGAIEQYCRRAVELGIDEIGFSDHLDLDPSDEGCGYYNFGLIDENINRAREMFKGSLRIKKGIEVTYQEEYRDKIAEVIEIWNYDYVIAGIHLSNGIFFTSRRTETIYAGFSDAVSAYKPYFEELHRAVNSGLVDIAGHFDVVKRHGEKVFGEFKPQHFSDIIEPILVDMIEMGVALEINAGDISNFNRERLYPSMWILETYFKMGGRKVTFGSDSHSVGALFGGYDVALSAAKRVGFPGWTVFKKRDCRIVEWGTSPPAPLLKSGDGGKI